MLRFLHISAAIIFVGGLFARQAVRALTSRASDVGEILPLTQAAGQIERHMVIPGNILSILFGLILALVTRSPILGSIAGPHRNWLLASIVILAILFPLVPWVFLPRGRAFESVLRDASAKGKITPELQHQLADPVVRWAHLAEMIAVGLIVALMVFRPF